MPELRRTRHELLVREFIRNGGNGAEAYRVASAKYASGVWRGRQGKPKDINHRLTPAACACRIMKYPEVQARIKELREQMAKRADITIDKVLTDYEHALRLAKAQAKPADIVNAATAQAKLVGLLRERVETGRPGDFENMENISDVLEAVAEQAGPEAAQAIAKAMGIELNEQTPPEQDEALEAMEPESKAVN